ncbi:anthranilate phosphoribosyltransferase [Bacillus sp. SM2101]|uniref:anthranilate phosphoribosyltransferase n=1 Tax=Bacillus sp. SM2101 TaxID=2805366 RepID=UPI001BDE8F24|nr:anthranilate phosphoribosyltransferase [Bacillus sp. SM2101]
MIKDTLKQLIEGNTLSEQQSFHTMNDIMSGQLTNSQLATLLTILRLRGETVDEITGFAKAMRHNMKTIEYNDEIVVDTCGTGGDGHSTFNISTAVAICLASLGVKVAKHGNRNVSSSSGSADVLEELNIQIETTPEQGKDALIKKGMTFLFAPNYHFAMKHAAPVRKEIGFRTLFNLLGPISNPANAKHQLIGIFDTSYSEKLAHTLHALGSKHVLFVTGQDGLDEISITADTDIVELKDGKVSRYVFSPEDAGLPRGNMEDLKISSPKESAKLIQQIFTGKANESATNIFLLNAGAGLYVAEQVSSIAEGVHQVKQAIDRGDVHKYYESIRNLKEEQLHA